MRDLRWEWWSGLRPRLEGAGVTPLEKMELHLLTPSLTIIPEDFKCNVLSPKCQSHLGTVYHGVGLVPVHLRKRWPRGPATCLWWGFPESKQAQQQEDTFVLHSDSLDHTCSPWQRTEFLHTKWISSHKMYSLTYKFLPPKLLEVLLLFLEKTGPTVHDFYLHKTSWGMRDGFGADIIPVVQKIHAEAFN